MDSRKKILIVGGAGYLGGAVTDSLSKMPDLYDIRVYDNLLYEESYQKPIDFVFGDVLDTETLKPQLDWADCVIWLAAIVGDGAGQVDEGHTFKVNQESIRWLADHYNKRIIFTSTCSVYGAQNDVILHEQSPVGPLSLYAATKVNSEGILANSNAVIFRLGTLFGVSDVFSRVRMDLVVNYLTAHGYFSKKINVFGGDQYRPLLHVKDAAQYIIEAIEFPQLDHAEVFNIAKTNMRIIDLAKKIIERFPFIELRQTEMPFEDTRNYRASVDKVNAAFTYRPVYDVEHGIEQIHQLMLERRIKDVKNPRYSNEAFLKGVQVKPVIEQGAVLIPGGIAFDDRGNVSFVNDFAFDGIKRFYAIENYSPSVIRAWHGHVKEVKHVFVSEGAFLVTAVKMDDTTAPNKQNPVQRFVLDARKPCILKIPAGYANGFRALTEENKIFFFSTTTMEEAKTDDFRFPADYWGEQIWETENR